MSKSLFILCRCRMVPLGRPLGCSPYRMALALGPRIDPSCVTPPPTGFLHRKDGRNELRVNGPKDGREKTLMWELENLGGKKKKRKKGKIK